MITGLWRRSTQFNRMPILVVTVLALMQSQVGVDIGSDQRVVAGG